MADIVCFGEVLWDVFPSDKMIGGAPLNVALRLHSFKNKVTVISSVGKDVNGADLLDYLDKEGLDDSCIQINEAFKTGEVLVSLDASGAASYVIAFPCAWDYILPNQTILNAVKKSDAFVFGSLIARNKVSHAALLSLLNVASFKVFDVNLRHPHFTISNVEVLMQKSDFIKFNDDELFEICRALHFNSNDLKKNIEFIAKHTSTSLICVTLGCAGAVIYMNRVFYFNDGYKVNVIDTVGAGDSFLAALIDKLLKKETPQNIIDFACTVGALVASNKGANPEITTKDIKLIKNS